MVKFQKYKFRKYDNNYPKLFLIEKRKLRKILPKEAKIEHVGSTAILGLGGKGLIDIFISVSKNKIKSAKIKLQKHNYTYKPKGGTRERLFFYKEYEKKNKVMLVHVHLTRYKSKVWQNNLKFRDILRKNNSLVKEYEAIKRKAVKFAKGEGKKYRAFKNKFIKDILKSC